MSKFVAIFLIVIFLGIIFVLTQNYVFLPSDILLTLPHFQEEFGFQIPQNSLTSDPIVQFEPWRMYAKERLLRGEMPFLNDLSALGAPFLANPQTQLFFPLTYIYYIFPVSVALSVIPLIKLLLFSLFSYFYLRSIDISKDIAIFGGFVLSTTAFFLMWIQWPHTNVYLFFPLFLYCVERIRSDSIYVYRYLTLLSLGFFLAILGGHPETLFLIGIVVFFYTLTRLYPTPRNLFLSYFFIFLGFLLSAFQLFPFLEYLFHSNMLFVRSTSDHGGSLPFLGSVLLFFPYLLGGPHFEFYKPLFQGSNFQELLGGYIGLPVLLFGLYSLWKVKKNSLSLFWIMTAVFSYGVSYGIFPFSLVKFLPIVNLAATQRFSAFFGFSMIVISILSLSEILQQNYNAQHGKKLRKVIVISSLCILSFSLACFLLPYLPIIPEKFFIFVKNSFLVYFLTTIFTLWFFYFFIKTKRFIFLFLLAVSLGLQMGYIFVGYNPFVSKEDYYPDTKLTRILSTLPKGTYMDVGNSAIPENVNLAYGFSNVENYDALEILKFRKFYDKLFPINNHWGNVDEVTVEHLRTIGVSYVISDYDIRQTKYDVFEERSDVLPKITSGSDLVFSFTYPQEISGIRLLPATFNRENDCTLNLEIKNSQETFYRRDNIACAPLVNNNFFTISLSTLPKNSDRYTVILSSPNGIEENSVSFFGKNSIPYVAVLTPNVSQNDFDLIARGNSWYLFEVLGSDFIETRGKVEVLSQKPEYISFIHESKKRETVSVKRANFPGWSVSIDNTEERLSKGPLLSVVVPSGRHSVKFSYTPFAFYLGSIMSVLTLLSLIIYFLRHEFKRPMRLVSSLTKLFISQDWYVHACIVCVSFALSTISIVILVSLLPINFTNPETTVINWLTVHNYPKSQDYLGFFILFPVMFILILGLWIFFLWILKKRRFS